MTKTIIASIVLFSFLPSWEKAFTAEIPCPDFKCYFEREALKKEQEQIIQREEAELFRTNQLMLQEAELQERERQNDLQEEQIEELKEQTKLQEESLNVEKDFKKRDLELREKELQQKAK